MNAENFAYWLQGFFELADTNELTKEQIQMIKDHLGLVFNKVTPDRPSKKKAKAGKGTKKALKELAEMTPPADAPSTTVSTEQIRINIEDALRKMREKPRDPYPYRTTCTWVGGGSSQKYC